MRISNSLYVYSSLEESLVDGNFVCNANAVDHEKIQMAVSREDRPLTKKRQGAKAVSL